MSRVRSNEALNDPYGHFTKLGMSRCSVTVWRTGSSASATPPETSTPAVRTTAATPTAAPIDTERRMFSPYLRPPLTTGGQSITEPGGRAAEAGCNRDEPQRFAG